MRLKIIRQSSAYKVARRYPLLPVAVIVMLAVMATFANVISPRDPLHSDLSKVKAPPVWVSEGTAE